ncbi:MAG: hypothetical protein ACKV2T_42755 [Kofleriaceae bacterium]
MGDYDLRVPELGDSLRRPRTPHLIPPEELRLDPPAIDLGPTPTRRPSPADIVRAHEGDVEEPEHEGEHHGPHGHVEIGVEGETGHPGVTGRIAGGVEIPIGDNVAVEAEGGVEGLGGAHVTGEVGAGVRIGPEASTHGLFGVEGEHLGSEHPVVTGRAGIGFGETGSLALTGGATLGDHPTGRFGLDGRVRLAPGLTATGNIGVDGLGGHPSLMGGAGLELDLNDRLALTGNVGATGVGTPDAAVTGGVGLRFRIP